MKSINRRLKTTFIFSTHDQRVIDQADRLVRVEDGVITAFGVRNEEKWNIARVMNPAQVVENPAQVVENPAQVVEPREGDTI